MDRKSTDFAVGLFVIAGILALLFLALKAGNLATLDFRNDTYIVTAKFDNIGSLKVRAPVRSAGVVVGRVKKLSFDNNTYQAVATMEIYNRFHFPKDTAAKILTSGLLGEQYVGLDPGGDPENLQAGDRIDNTQSAVVLENLIGQFLFSKAAEGRSDNGNGTTGTTSAGAAPATNTGAAKPAAPPLPNPPGAKPLGGKAQ